MSPAGLCPIVTSADGNFAMPLATALRSLAQANGHHWPIDVVVLVSAFPREERRRVEASLPPDAVHIRWEEVDLAPFRAFRPLSYLPPMSYARLSLERHLAPDASRIVYLDADTLVLDDLAPLASTPLGSAVVGAVPDDYLDAALAGRRPLKHGGVPRVARYFNSGVLVIDVPKWRRGGVAERAIAYLAAHPRSPFADQDALNVACDGAWHELAPRWNFQDHRVLRIDRMPAAQRPAIAHFVSTDKPWKPGGDSRNAAFYDGFRARTAYRRTVAHRLADLAEAGARRTVRFAWRHCQRWPAVRRRS